MIMFEYLTLIIIGFVIIGYLYMILKKLKSPFITIDHSGNINIEKSGPVIVSDCSAEGGEIGFNMGGNSSITHCIAHGSKTGFHSGINN